LGSPPFDCEALNFGGPDVVKTLPLVHELVTTPEVNSHAAGPAGDTNLDRAKRIAQQVNAVEGHDALSAQPLTIPKTTWARLASVALSTDHLDRNVLANVCGAFYWRRPELGSSAPKRSLDSCAILTSTSNADPLPRVHCIRSRITSVALATHKLHRFVRAFILGAGRQCGTEFSHYDPKSSLSDDTIMASASATGILAFT